MPCCEGADHLEGAKAAALALHLQGRQAVQEHPHLPAHATLAPRRPKDDRIRLPDVLRNRRASLEIYASLQAPQIPSLHFSCQGQIPWDVSQIRQPQGSYVLIGGASSSLCEDGSA